RGMSLSTDVAEYLVTKGVPFRDSHWKVGNLVKWCIHNRKALQDLTMEQWQALIPEVEDDILPLLDLRTSVSRRATLGGTSPERVMEEVKRARDDMAGLILLFQAFEFNIRGFYPSL
ncbi:MAG: hypothetical protein JW971_10885, partial [Synergistales bacterium]|nr:hypothetical protein [Synergistales bacterium]